MSRTNSKNNKMTKSPHPDEESDAPPSKEQKSAKVSPPEDDLGAGAARARFAVASSVNQLVVDDTRKFIDIINPTKTLLEEALANVGDNDPVVVVVVVVDFDPDVLGRAVVQANLAMPVLPVWMHGVYPLTAMQLRESIFGHLSQAGSGAREGCILATQLVLFCALARERVDHLCNF
jgi:hypothetical protein